MCWIGRNRDDRSRRRVKRGHTKYADCSGNVRAEYSVGDTRKLSLGEKEGEVIMKKVPEFTSISDAMKWAYSIAEEMRQEAYSDEELAQAAEARALRDLINTENEAC